MLDFAELVVLNKFDKRAAADALRDVRKQWKRNHLAFTMNDEDVPVYPTIASQFNDPGISWMFVNLMRLLRAKLGLPDEGWTPDVKTEKHTPSATVLIPGSRIRYLAEIAEQGRDINKQIEYLETLIKVDGKLLETGDIRITDYILALNNYITAKNLVVQNQVARYQVIQQINYWNMKL